MNKTINILMVEDNHDDIEITRRTIEKVKPYFKLDFAYSGKDCLTKIKNKQFDIVLLDYSLPGMNGLEVLIKLVSQKPDLPVIMVTGQGDEKIAVKSMREGAVDYLIKSDNYLKVLPVVVEKAIEKFEFKKQQHRLEQETLDKKSKLEATLNSTSDGIIVVSYIEGKEIITLANRRFEEIFGEITKNIVNQTCDEFIVKFKNSFKDSDEFVRKTLELCKIKNKEDADILEVVHPENMIIERFSGPVYGDKGEIIGRIWSFRDITAMKKMEAELKKMSVTDSLTKLYNQGHFFDELEREIDRATRQKYSLSLILFDIDKFKGYNDKYGHQAGDRIIEKVGVIAGINIRENVDSAYRYGGDEFTIILPDINMAQSKRVAERIRKSFAETAPLSLSIGLAKFKPDYSVKTLVKYADEAMYQAKKTGGNRVVIAKEEEVKK